MSPHGSEPVKGRSWLNGVSAPMVAMNTHFCHIRAMISSLMLASNPAPESWS
jgi:hypothetical protein